MIRGRAMLLVVLATGAVLAEAVVPVQAGTVTVVTPAEGENAYRIAGEAAADLWQEATGVRPEVIACPAAGMEKLPAGDLLLVGSDSVQPLVHELIRKGALESLGIRYGSDEYRLLSLEHEGRTWLIVAGGCGRSTLYAVYDLFRRQCGAEYFWDGDVVPKSSEIRYQGLDVTERPRFDYRGLRYFAHRGLHRFQAEHWDLEDWKREIDWCVKKRFNMFMLRTGIDDLFQRAFPDDVPYPPTDAKDPDGVDRSYDDRTSFWALKYRGELRKQVLAYARDRGLLHPEDTGTITHWYSHTPSSFYGSRPDFPVIRDQRSGYSLPTQAIWDIESQVTWDSYWKLTETHIREFGQPRIFHTIGMAERTFGGDDRDNLQRKLYVYRKTQQMLREHYPDAPLLIASWDFIGWKWTDEGVNRLLSEFDPKKTILLDYTADCGRKATYRDWGSMGHFPWIFGIFHGFARNSDVHEDYSLLVPRLEEAAADAMSRGLVLWSEISHNDTFLLEYLGANSWQPQEVDLAVSAARYCRTRYPADAAGRMEKLWGAFLEASQLLHWHDARGEGNTWFGEPQYRMLAGSAFLNLTPERVPQLQADLERFRSGLTRSPEVLAGLAEMAPAMQDDALWRRDALDMARTIASRALVISLMDASLEMENWRQGKSDGAAVRRQADLSRRLIDALADVLAQSDDFSMYASLRHLEKAEPIGGVAPTINPHSELTLKSNAENSYCRSHHYELVRHVYRAELEVYWEWVLGRIESGDKSPWKRPAEFAPRAKEIADKFYETPLAEMAPPEKPGDLAGVLTGLEGLVKESLGGGEGR
ncbi:MAG: alpha-N-acetylglucosaminidase TIM-barrel domain-containing protein [Thermoguttaceae bacterium]